MILHASRRCLALLLLAAFVASSTLTANAAERKKIVLIAGKKSHGPVGNGIHDYPWSVRLLKVMLENSNVKDSVRVETHFDGWVDDDSTLDDADTIMVISDGRDGDKYVEAPHFRNPRQTALIAKQMQRGCGFATFHFSTFAPDQHAEQILDWSGGYFDWETDGQRKWYSAITTTEAQVQLGAPDHPVSRGLAPFKMKEEFYYNIRFREGPNAPTPIWTVPALPGRQPDGRVVAWARQREDGGRGFGTTAGHFYANWEHENFRKMILNALVWTAGVEVPPGGVQAHYYTHDQILAALAEDEVSQDDAIDIVIVTGHQYPGHKWQETTPALIEALRPDKRINVKVAGDIEFLASPQLHTYDAMILNYCNWERPEGISEAAKENFVKYLKGGGGLTIIHFANGAFHFSLPKAGASDWPEYRNICRRAWDHTEGKSGHDRYGPFRVDIAAPDHPITKGLKPFDTIDELYFRQQGDGAIEVLATAKSKITGADEPMAFVYNYGQGRVFQTVLGHAAESIRAHGAAELIRRGAVWTANKPQQGESATPDQRDGASASPPKREKITGHWGEDAIGFRWTEQDSVDGRWNQTDVGPFLASTVPLPGGIAEKGLTIRVGDRRQASVCFDTGMLNLRAGWTGGFLRFDPARYGLINAPAVDGDVQFSTRDGPGWIGAAAKYRGMHLHGERVVLSYNVAQTGVLESPWWEVHGEIGAFSRTLQIGPRAAPLEFVACDAPGKAAIQTVDGAGLAVAIRDGRAIAVAIVGADDKATIRITGESRIIVSIPQGDDTVRCKLLAWSGEALNLSRFAALVKASAPPGDLRTLQQPGPPRWTAPIETRGKLGEPQGPFAVDTLTLPFDNPHQALMFVGGHDFFSNGDAAVCTIHGDVWRMSGIDASLQRLTWKRFATGLFQALGLRIVDDQVYVLGRDQITRLHDDNGDGEADFYENFNNDGATSAGGHDYATCLETDSAGNFYYLRANEGLVRVSADGSLHESIATGFRNPNGMSVGPGDVITVAPQEGEWTPASNIAQIKPGGYYGYGGPRSTPERPLGYDPPLCWIPRLMDNSSGGQVWVSGDVFKPLAGQMLHLCYGRCWPLLVLREDVGGVHQGGAVKLPVSFDSGVMRGRFNRHDGQLYVSGLKGWASAAARDGCLQRVRYTGEPLGLPVAVKTFANGLKITFSEPLEKAYAEDADNYALQQWNYHWRAEYGSPEYSVANPRREARDEVDVRSATLLDDGRSVFLEISPLLPVMQMAIEYRIRSASGAPLQNTIYYTINKVDDFRLDTGRARPAQLRPGRLTREEEANLASGLIARFEGLSENDLERDARPARMAALFVPPGDPATPFMSAGPYRALFEGYLKVKLRGDYRFAFAGAGTAELLVNGESVLQAAGADLAEAASRNVSLHKGYNRIAVRYTPRDNEPARLRLNWTSESFATEPVPPDVLFYDQRDPELQHARKLRRGRELFAVRRCGKCHDATPGGASSALLMPELAASAPNLAGAGNRLNSDWVFQWLLEPRKLRNHTTMPRLFDASSDDDRRQVADIAGFLDTLRGDPVNLSQAANATEIKQGEILFENLGCISCHRLTPPRDDDEFDRTSLHHVSAKFRSGALVAFLLDPRKHYGWSRMPDFRLNETEAAALAAYFQKRTRQEPAGQAAAPPGDAKRGRELFAKVGCAACHQVGEAKAAAPSRSFPRAIDAGAGCLASGATGPAPQFDFDDGDRDALAVFLATRGESLLRASPVEASRRMVEHLRCNACHNRDGSYSVWPEVLFEEGVQGHAPELVPHLTWAGEKLHADWTARFLAGRAGYRPRPWMKARMPAFAARANVLARGFAAEHGLTADERPPTQPLAASETKADRHKREIGRRLMLKDGGLDCLQCHAMTDEVLKLENKSHGVGLAYIQERLRYDYYRRWMRDPLRIDPGSKMVKFAPDGKTTTLRQVYDGDARQQFDAIWSYLQSLPPPERLPKSRLPLESGAGRK